LVRTYDLRVFGMLGRGFVWRLLTAWWPESSDEAVRISYVEGEKSEIIWGNCSILLCNPRIEII
jgi:hypothetical protein